MSTTASTSTTGTGKSTLDQADYLKLLVTQLTSQNPLDPQSDTAFASELAQFSSLQETQSLGYDVQTLQANTLIGQQVQVQNSTNSTQTDSGTVTGVDIVSGKPELLVNGSLYTMSQLLSISPPAATTANGSSSSN